VSHRKTIKHFHEPGHLHEFTFSTYPPRRGLCGKAVDWNWSSARYYLNELPGQQEPDLPLIHGPPPGALD
jgi:hypothetical protein